jgi:hypothetical protein
MKYEKRRNGFVTDYSGCSDYRLNEQESQKYRLLEIIGVDIPKSKINEVFPVVEDIKLIMQEIAKRKQG